MTGTTRSAADFEKLGVFYLGRRHDPTTDVTSPEPLLYDARDLTTHAVCVGMTGSGKTGLCLSLLEEAAIDGIPAIAIDPKGDVGNLLLTFPELRPEDFAPWVDPGEAERKGRTLDAHAAVVAETWRRGLAEWGQDGERIRRLREAADFAIYTPGSDAGLPLRVLRSFTAPDPALVVSADGLRDRVAAAVSGLLALLGIEADPIRSREHILLATLVDDAWRDGRDLDLTELIRRVQSPPFETVGALDLESFFPVKERAELAVRLNGLLASPGFAPWLEGEPLDVARLLWTPEGKPRVSILSIAHLSEAERMFFVTLLLGEVVAWMRTQPGTTSLRAVLYMDEVFGFFPPVANPPSKTPMLTLLKQARAYGLGVVLATQNPVDLDYKGLSNAGTWLLGRLQTERDVERVLDGLEAASGGALDRSELARTVAGLGSRVFLMNDVHEDGPVVFGTRWALSYLRGPLTRSEIARLMAERKREDAGGPARREAAGRVAAGRVAAAGGAREGSPGAAGQVVPSHAERPILPPGVAEVFLDSPAAQAPAASRSALRPTLLGSANLHFVDAKAGVDTWRRTTLLAPVPEETETAPWAAVTILEEEPAVRDGPPPGAIFAPLPAAAKRAASYRMWEKALRDHLYREGGLELRRCAALRLTANPGETDGEFRVRVREAARERRDTAVEKLRERWGPRLTRLEERIRAARERQEREEAQYRGHQLQTAISVGSTVLGALLGRRRLSATTLGRATTAARGAGRTARQKEDVGRAGDRIEDLERLLLEMQADVEADVERLRAELDPDALPIETHVVRPRKSDLAVERVALAWLP